MPKVFAALGDRDNMVNGEAFWMGAKQLGVQNVFAQIASKLVILKHFPSNVVSGCLASLSVVLSPDTVVTIKAEILNPNAGRSAL